MTDARTNPATDPMLLDLPERIERLESLRALKPGWDSYKAQPPNHVEVDVARSVLVGLDPYVQHESTGPLIDGGVRIVCWRGGHKLTIDVSEEQT